MLKTSPCDNPMLRLLRTSVVVSGSAVRAALVSRRDLRNDVGYQNDVNKLIGALETAEDAWSAAGPLVSVAA